jgi:Domain of unknown function (DUF4384)
MKHSAQYACAALIALALPLPAQTNPQQGPYRMEISLERRESGAWHTVDPGLVLEQNDRVRFRFHTNFSGYLYVMNRSTSGTYSMLFPGEETGRENQIRAGKDYVVPATQTLFRIGGPPGHEIVYWMVTPAELSTGEEGHTYVPLPPPPPKEKQLPSNMTPRCDDALFRARGDCIDTSAGPKNVTSRELLPDNLAQVPSEGSGDLMFMRKQNTAVVSSPVPLKGPVIYEFHLAHK